MDRCVSRRRALVVSSAAIVLASCAVAPPAPSSAPPPAQPPTASAPADAAPLQRPRARWVPVDYAELPGWGADRTAEAWTALRRGCERPPPAWAAVCAQALRETPRDDAAARAWLMARLQPYRVEGLDGAVEGLATGYYEPLVEAARRPQGTRRAALHTPPPDLATRRPYWTRRQLDTEPAAQASLRGREIAYVEPLDALVLQIQGSGRLNVAEPDGRTRTVRVAFAGHNGAGYRSVGRWLIEQGELAPHDAAWPAIRDWAERHPQRLNEMLWSNPRVVFFREEALPDPQLGPKGAQGVALTPGRSIAVDPQAVPYGTPVWIDTTEPLSTAPLRRLVMAQDTGSAIVGAVRADVFWGWGETAAAQAGRMKQPLRWWALWPRGAAPS